MLETPILVLLVVLAIAAVVVALSLTAFHRYDPQPSCSHAMRRRIAVNIGSEVLRLHSDSGTAKNSCRKSS